MNWTPTADRVLLRRIEAQPTGRIVIPEQYRELTREFEVVAIGPKVTDVEVKQHVVLPGIAAEEPDKKLGGYILVRQEDIGAIVSRSAAKTA